MKTPYSDKTDHLGVIIHGAASVAVRGLKSLIGHSVLGTILATCARGLLYHGTIKKCTGMHLNAIRGLTTASTALKGGIGLQPFTSPARGLSGVIEMSRNILVTPESYAATLMSCFNGDLNLSLEAVFTLARRDDRLPTSYLVAVSQAIVAQFNLAEGIA